MARSHADKHRCALLDKLESRVASSDMFQLIAISDRVMEISSQAEPDHRDRVRL